MQAWLDPWPWPAGAPPAGHHLPAHSKASSLGESAGRRHPPRLLDLKWHNIIGLLEAQLLTQGGGQQETSRDQEPKQQEDEKEAEAGQEPSILNHLVQGVRSKMGGREQHEEDS